jgi:hypothetical protein
MSSSSGDQRTPVRVVGRSYNNFFIDLMQLLIGIKEKVWLTVSVSNRRSSDRFRPIGPFISRRDRHSECTQMLSIDTEVRSDFAGFPSTRPLCFERSGIVYCLVLSWTVELSVWPSEIQVEPPIQCGS